MRIDIMHLCEKFDANEQYRILERCDDYAENISEIELFKICTEIANDVDDYYDENDENDAQLTELIF